MAKPAPQSGLVIRYDYLWVDEQKEGREEGGKERPCAVVVAVQATTGQPLRAIVCAVTHTPPTRSQEAVEMPSRVKAHLGLDIERSWICVGEVNIVDWDDAGIVPVAPGRWAYGFLPPALARRVALAVAQKSKGGKLGLVDRPAIERKRERRESRGKPGKAGR